MKVAAELVRRILLDGRAGPRLLNETSVEIDVWISFATEPDNSEDLLLMPFDGTPAPALARELNENLRKRDPVPRLRRIAPLEAAVAAELSFEDFVSEVLPRTGFEVAPRLEDLRTLMLAWRDRKDAASAPALTPRPAPEFPAPEFTGREFFDFLAENLGRLSPDLRLAALVALLVAARKHDKEKEISEAALNKERQVPELFASEILPLTLDSLPQPADDMRSLIWRVASNRTVERLAVSVNTIKADAALRLFEVDCRALTWAVIDSGIDGSHPAFRDHEAGNFATRVDKAYDFSRLREMASFDALTDRDRYDELLSKVASKLSISRREAGKLLSRLRDAAADGRPFDWEALSRVLQVATDRLELIDGKPDGHGTHVAGVLAGDWQEDDKSIYRGVCPNMRLLDLRVLGDSEKATEFAVMAALEFVRWLNSRNRYMTVHGVNLSIGLRFDRNTYACGRTPVCRACEDTVASGVTVVAAAGNWGSHKFTTDDGNFSGYASISIADPGNAASVITVGATHRDRPHEYGVSFFSSRGPTADGRAKPDVVAPGERIDGPLPNLGFGRLDGTSMAAPHVSGVAALLMARHSELIGKPERVKAIIIESATSLGREPYFQGAGLVDALRALQKV